MLSEEVAKLRDEVDKINKNERRRKNFSALAVTVFLPVVLVSFFFLAVHQHNQ